jgi:membrane-bound lytic murein transglycosylase B
VASKVSRTEVPEALVSSSLKPEKTVADFAEAGVASNPEMRADQPVALLELQQRNGPEYWLTTNNFYVITRYNRSPLYAMAVFQLSEAIRDAYHSGES